MESQSNSSHKADGLENDAQAPPISLPPPPLPPPIPTSGKTFLSSLLSLFVWMFLVDAAVSLLDDSLILFFGSHALTGMRSILSVLGGVMGFLVYSLMGLTLWIPKRTLLPLALFNPIAGLVVIPFLIYAFNRIQQVAWAVSFYQVLLCLVVLYLLRRRSQGHGPLIPADQFQGPFLNWRNAWVFHGLNIVALPFVAAYLLMCVGLAVNHYTNGFASLRAEGLTVQVRKYVRNDGKSVLLVPMAHIGENAFYQKLSVSFPTNSTVLMEGVSDAGGLLTNKISYEKMAKALGVSEQQKVFRPRGKMVMADVDVGQFSKDTIDLLNLVMLLQTQGLNLQTANELMQRSEPAHVEEQLFEDILRKRNRHLLGEIQKRLEESSHLVVPWGAAHMPEVGQGIEHWGFKATETNELVAIRFRSTAKNN